MSTWMILRPSWVASASVVDKEEFGTAELMAITRPTVRGPTETKQEQ